MSDIFSSHAPTGYSQTTVVSPNENSTHGRNIGYPAKFDLYVKKISTNDGSSTVVESREVSDIQGSRLYLYHRPLVNADGTITTITTSDGVIDSSSTNARLGYIVFSSVPTSSFTVTYMAAPDCGSMWHFNTLSDSVMEIEKVLGPTNLTGYPGLRNLHYAVLDVPGDAVSSGVAQNAIYVSHLDRDIRFSSSTDSSISATRGTSHTINIGYKTDTVIIDATGIKLYESDATKTARIELGTRTGDLITYKGSLSGAGPLIIGGPEWAYYSGVFFSTALTGSFYSGSLLRVHGDAAFMGNVKAYGNITIVNTTGTTSTVLGDWTVNDELFVYGQSHLFGTVNTNTLINDTSITINGNIIAGNTAGAGEYSHSLVDNLDCSEVAWTYTTIAGKTYPNSIVDGPMKLGYSAPLKTVNTTWNVLGANKLPGDHLAITGALNATAGPSGAHPAILQLLMNVDGVTGFFRSTYGTLSGVWSPGMLDPGTCHVRMLDGVSAGTDLPIYGYTIEASGINNITRLNVFTPEMPSSIPQTNDKYMLYQPGNVTYQYIYTAGGANPTFQVSGSTTDPLKIAFDDHVRITTSLSSSYSMKTALEYSVSGLSTPATGVCYIIADSYNTDPESSPLFKARALPFRREKETVIGEVVASTDGASWTILETVSYRPNGFYDSCWIPVIQNVLSTHPSGRAIPGLTSSSTSPLRMYFSHDIGPDVDATKVTADLYLATPSPNTPSQDYTQSYLRSMFCQDVRNGHGLSGALIHVPLGAKRVSSATSERDASIFYFDSRLIGIDISPDLMDGFPTGGSSYTSVPTYLRLVVKRDA